MLVPQTPIPLPETWMQRRSSEHGNGMNGGIQSPSTLTEPGKELMIMAQLLIIPDTIVVGNTKTEY